MSTLPVKGTAQWFSGKGSDLPQTREMVWHGDSQRGLRQEEHAAPDEFLAMSSRPGSSSIGGERGRFGHRAGLGRGGSSQARGSASVGEGDSGVKQSRPRRDDRGSDPSPRRRVFARGSTDSAQDRGCRGGTGARRDHARNKYAAPGRRPCWCWTASLLRWGLSSGVRQGLREWGLRTWGRGNKQIFLLTAASDTHANAHEASLAYVLCCLYTPVLLAVFGMCFSVANNCCRRWRLLDQFALAFNYCTAGKACKPSAFQRLHGDSYACVSGVSLWSLDWKATPNHLHSPDSINIAWGFIRFVFSLVVDHLFLRCCALLTWKLRSRCYPSAACLWVIF